jgi:hypothetical protein
VAAFFESLQPDEEVPTTVKVIATETGYFG